MLLTSGPVHVGVESALWRRVAGGGRLREPVTLPLPSLRRTGGVRLAVEARTATPPDAPLAVSVDGDPPSRVTLSPDRLDWLALPARAQDGAEVRLAPEGQVAVKGILIAPRPEWGHAVAAGLAVTVLALMLLRARPRATACGLALLASGAIALGCIPGWILLAWPGGGTQWRLAVPVTVAIAGLVLALRDRGRRRGTARLALLIAAGVFGCWVRAFFLPSAGSWDVDYWRTAMLQADRSGLASVYGGRDDVPEGHLLSQLSGRERVSSFGGGYIILNYPPLAVALWTASWRLVARWGHRLEPLEAEALATKLPSLAGDLAAVAALLWIHRCRPWRAATLAALYWATPVSWLNSAVQGYQDGAYAPLVVVALAAAAAGHGFWAGALLGVAAMFKLPALIVAPAVAGALIAAVPARVGLRRVTAAAAGGLLAIAIALAPFALAPHTKLPVDLFDGSRTLRAAVFPQG